MISPLRKFPRFWNSRPRRTRARTQSISRKLPKFETLETRNLLTVTIDTFDSQQVVEDPPAEPPPGVTDSSSSLDVPLTEAIGGQRDMLVQRTAAIGDVLLTTSFGTPSFLEINLSAASTGFGQVTWDGQDNDPETVNTNGLNNFDLTEGGVNTEFRFRTVDADLSGGTVTMRVWTAGGTLTTSSFAIPTIAQNISVPFTDFAGADFTQLGAIQIELTGPSGIDASIDGIVAIAGPDIDIQKMTNMVDADTPTGPIIPVGDTATFTYAVTNPGDVALSNVVVTDDNGTPGDVGDDFSPTFVDGDTNANMLLDLDETWTYTADRMVTPGQYSNIADVVGDDVDTGAMVMSADPSNHFGQDLLDIDIQKATDGQDADTPTGPIIAVGDTAIFTYEVTNPGNVPLSVTSVNDDNGTPLIMGDDFMPNFVGGDTNSDGFLDLDETWLYTANRVVTPGQYTNIASVVGEDPITSASVNAEDPSNHFGQDELGIDIQKMTNMVDADTPTGPVIPVGDTATFTYQVTNTGLVPLSNVTVTDDNGTPGVPGDDFSPTFVDGDTNNDMLLDLDETWQYTADRTVTAGQYSNIADVVGTDADTGAMTTAEDPSNHFGQDVLDIDIQKATNGDDADTPTGPVIAIGDTATFTYEVTNPGNVPLSVTFVNDDNGTPGDTGDDFMPNFVGGDTNSNGFLDLDETWLYTADRVVSPGQYTNIASVIGEDPITSATVNAEDPSNHFGQQPLGIDIQKLTNMVDADTPTGPVIPVGDTATFTYQVTNTGLVPLSNVTVTDDNGTPGVPGDDFSPTFVDGDTNNDMLLDLDETWQYTADRTVTAGQYSNIADVVGTDADTGAMTTAEDPSNHFGQDELGIDIQKMTNMVDADTPTGPVIPVGDTATFTYVVTNTGAVPLSDVVVTDDNGTPIITGDDFIPMFVGGDTNMDMILDLDETWQYTAARTVTAGQYTNLADVVGTDADTGAMTTAEDPSNHLGQGEIAIDIQKLTNGQDADIPLGPVIPVGDTATFTYVVTNPGTVALDVTSISDDNGTPGDTGDDFTPTFVSGDTNSNNLLDTTETWTYTADRTVTAGQYTNMSTVTGQDPTTSETADANDPSNHYGQDTLDIDIQKLTNGEDADMPMGPIIPIGDTATFTYEVTNPGNVPLSVTSVNDDNGTPGDTGDDFMPNFVGGDTNSDGFLDLDETWTYTADRVVTPGQYTNIASVVGADPVTSATVMADDPSNHFGQMTDVQIDIQKLTNGEDADDPMGPIVTEGDTVMFTYIVTNPGDVALQVTEIEDNNGTPGDPSDDFAPTFMGGDANMNGLVDPGEMWQYSAQRIATLGQYTNIATVTGADPQTMETDSASDPSNHFGEPLDMIDIDIQKLTNDQDADDPTGPEIPVGDTATFTYQVTNPGDVALMINQITDNNGTPGDNSDDFSPTFVSGDTNSNGLLDTTETWLYTAQRTVTEGQYTNLATVVGADPDTLETATAADPSNHLGVIIGTPDIALQKQTNGEDANDPPGPMIPIGDTATFTYLVTNPGEVALMITEITDDDGTPLDDTDDFSPVFVGGDTNTNGLLDLTETWTYTADRVVTAGQFTNIAEVKARDPQTSDIVSATATDPSNHFGVPQENPDIDIIKIANDTPDGETTILDYPQEVWYKYLVTNTGDTYLSDIEVVDDNGTPGDIVVGDFLIGFDMNRAGDGRSGFFVEDTISGLGVLFDVSSDAQVDTDSGLIISDTDLLVSPEFADTLLDLGLAEDNLFGADVGDARIDADTTALEENLQGVTGGTTSVFLDVPLIEDVTGLTLLFIDSTADPFSDDFQAGFAIESTSDFTFSTEFGFQPVSGAIRHSGSVTFTDDILVGLIEGPLAPGESEMLMADIFVPQDRVNKGIAFGTPTDELGNELELDPVMAMDEARVVIHNKISGKVFIDYDNDGYFDWGEKPIPGVQIALTRMDAEEETRYTTTDEWGKYHFDWLEPGLYKVTQNQPQSFKDGKNTPGSPGADNPDFEVIEYEAGVVDDMFSGIELANGIHAEGYNFAELLYSKRDYTSRGHGYEGSGQPTYGSDHGSYGDYCPEGHDTTPHKTSAYGNTYSNPTYGHSSYGAGYTNVLNSYLATNGSYHGMPTTQELVSWYYGSEANSQHFSQNNYNPSGYSRLARGSYGDPGSWDDPAWW